jgi:3-oxoacyl-[acyl-carrier protein] reductase
MRGRLDGRVAVICGASDGIGAAIARLFAEAGASTILVARREVALRELATSLAGGGKHRYIVADFASDKGVESLAQNLSLEPRIDVLVNNAGGPPPNGPLDISISEVQAALQAHLLTAMRLSQAVVPVMRKGGYGRIMQVVSVTARVPLVHLTASNIARGAVLAWSKTLSEALAPEGITVNNILPGYTLTERLQHLLDDSSRKLGISRAEAEARILAGIPQKRFARPDEIAAAALYLASGDAGYVTGVSLPVDGGFIKTV